MISASSSAFTDRSSIAFAGQHAPVPCASSNCGPPRPSCTPAAPSIWEWEMRLLDEEPGSGDDDVPLCLGGRGAAPPQFCGGPTGYRLMLKRQRMGETMCTPVQMEAVMGMLAASDPEVAPETWRSYRQIL